MEQLSNLEEIITSLGVENQTNHRAMRPILVVGKTGNGKSSICNMRDFHTEVPGDVTRELNMVTQTVRGRKLTIVDAPGTMDPIHPEAVVSDETSRAIAMANEGYDAFLIVIKRISDFGMCNLSVTTIVDNILTTLRPESYAMCRNYAGIIGAAVGMVGGMFAAGGSVLAVGGMFAAGGFALAGAIVGAAAGGRILESEIEWLKKERSLWTERDSEQDMKPTQPGFPEVKVKTVQEQTSEMLTRLLSIMMQQIRITLPRDIGYNGRKKIKAKKLYNDSASSVDDKANKIRSNFQMICDQVDTQRLLDQMYQGGIISADDMNEISNSNRNKTQKLLMTLFRYKKLESWIPEFLNFIQNNNKHVYRVIMKTDVPLVKESQRLMFSQIFSKNVKCDNTSGKRAIYIREIIRRNSALIIKEMEAKLQNAPYIKTRYNLSDDDCVFIDSQTDDLGRIEAAMICLLGKDDNHWVYDFLRSMRAVIGDKRLVGMFNIPINININ